MYGYKNEKKEISKHFTWNFSFLEIIHIFICTFTTQVYRNSIEKENLVETTVLWQFSIVNDYKSRQDIYY